MRTIVAAALALGLACCAFGQKKPDFSGEWTMNFEKSKFGENYRAPAKWVDKISQKATQITVDRLELTHIGKRSGRLFYTLNGKECANEVNGNTIKSVVEWDEEELLFHHKAVYNGKAIQLDDRWSLAKDGKTLSVTRHFEGSGITADQTIVFDKTGN